MKKLFVIIISLIVIGLVLYASGVFANPYVEKPWSDDSTGQTMGSLGYQIWIVYADGSKENLVVLEQTQAVIKRDVMKEIHSVEFRLEAKGSPQYGQTAAVIDWSQSTFAVTANILKYGDRSVSLMKNGQPVPAKVLDKNHGAVYLASDVPLTDTWTPIYGWGIAVQGNINSALVPDEGLLHDLQNQADHIFNFVLSGVIKYRGATQETLSTYTASGSFEFSVDVSPTTIMLSFQAPWSAS